MQFYNENVRAGIHQYEIGDDYIIVRWHKASYDYKFTYESAGKIAVDAMKMMAENKRGLSTYITTQVKDKFSEKIPVKGKDKTNFMNIDFK